MAAQAPITHFEPDPDRLAVIAKCTQDYDTAQDPSAEWPSNILSKRTVVYGSGRIARSGDPIFHVVDPAELELCQRLSSEVAELMVGTEVGMGSESDDEFAGFFIAGNVGEAVPAAITKAMIRERFGGTIFPPAKIAVEPLAEEGEWWREVVLSMSRNFGDDPAEGLVEYLEPWRRMIEWFERRAEFVDSVFVRIGDFDALLSVPEEKYPAGTVALGCVFPRMALGLTFGGSLVGLFGVSMETTCSCGTYHDFAPTKIL